MSEEKMNHADRARELSELKRTLIETMVEIADRDPDPIRIFNEALRYVLEYRISWDNERRSA